MALGPVVDPVKNFRVPEKRVLSIVDVVIFVGEVEEARWNALRLEDVEQREAITLRQAVVERVVDDELGRAEVGNVILRVELRVSCVLRPDGTQVVVSHKPQFLRCESGLRVRDTVMRDDSFEFTSKVMALDPVGHVLQKSALFTT